jgi:hypothetical protein
MLTHIAVLSQEGILGDEYTPQGQTVNEHFYLQVLRHLCDVV